MRVLILTAALISGLAGSVQAQSMNIPLIVNNALEQVCGPWMQTGDRSAAVMAAQSLGYRVFDLDTGVPVDLADPGRRMIADGSLFHRGQIILIESHDRVCSIDMAEAEPGQVDAIAADALTALGMERVLDQSDGPIQVVVWTGPDRQAVTAPSTRSTGAALTLSWLRPQ